MNFKVLVIFAGIILYPYFSAYALLDTDTTQLPTQANFLSQILNRTEKELLSIAQSFSFLTNVSAEDVTLIQYTEKGNFSTNLLNSEGIQISVNDKIVIIIHGFQSSGTEDWIKNMVEVYQQNGFRNTLAVDWNTIAKQNYILAAGSTKNVGELVADWLFNNIFSDNSANIKNIHLVGHSLGAHIAGFLGKRIFYLTGDEKVGRISGLDAAAPFFEYPILVPPSLRLSEDDSEEVDTYHTNSGFLGFRTALGKQDFYINYGGPIQPICDKGLKVIESFRCSHSFVHEFFTKTINSTSYIAKKCKNMLLAKSQQCDKNISVIMGQNNNATELSGTFYEDTDTIENFI